MQHPLWKFWSRGREAGAEVPPLTAATEDSAQALVQQLAQQASHLGRDAAQTRGALEDTQRVVQTQVEAMHALMLQLDEVARVQQSIAAATTTSQQAVVGARGAVAQVDHEVHDIVQVLREVSGAAESIGQIALQTRLVAFNASVEAHRAGAAGQGFGVVANAVKDLATRVETASRTIQSTLLQLNERIDRFTRETLQDGGAAAVQRQKSGLHGAFTAVEAAVREIGAAADASRRTCEDGRARGAVLAEEMQRAMVGLDDATGCSERFLSLSERMIQDLARCGCTTPDTPYIEAAQAAAASIADLLEAALARGDVGLQDLFDTRYAPIAGSQPPQFAHVLNPLTDRLFPAVQEPLLTQLPDVVFCIAVDRTGYVSTHNQQYCHPQRPQDPVWNTAHSRWRRRFDDRTGLASAQSEAPFLLQTYRRDMGGQYVLMKEASAPIRVQGRHWGGLRLAYRFS